LRSRTAVSAGVLPVFEVSFHVILTQENFGALKIQLDEADMALMTKLNRNTRFNDPVRYWGLNLFA
jgi:diketogulonate reductase-like aldo/keto reductase